MARAEVVARLGLELAMSFEPTTRLVSTLPHIDCPCGARRVYPLLETKLPEPGTQSMCLVCSRLWSLESYRLDPGGAWTWTWAEVASQAATPRLAPLIAEPQTETVSQIAACVVRAYEEIPMADDYDDDEQRVVAMVNGRGGRA